MYIIIKFSGLYNHINQWSSPMISMKNIFILYKRNLVNPEVIYLKKKRADEQHFQKKLTFKEKKKSPWRNITGGRVASGAVFHKIFPSSMEVIGKANCMKF